MVQVDGGVGICRSKNDANAHGLERVALAAALLSDDDLVVNQPLDADLPPLDRVGLVALRGIKALCNCLLVLRVIVDFYP